MRKVSLRTIGFVLFMIVLAAVVICFDDIKASINETMVQQTESLMD